MGRIKAIAKPALLVAALLAMAVGSVTGCGDSGDAPTPQPAATVALSPSPTPQRIVEPPTATPAPEIETPEDAELRRVTQDVIARHHRAVVEHAPEWMIAAHLASEAEIHECLEAHAKRRIAEGIEDGDRALHSCVLQIIEQTHTHDFFGLSREERQARLESLIASTCYDSSISSVECIAKMHQSLPALVDAEDPLELHEKFTETYFD